MSAAKSSTVTWILLSDAVTLLAQHWPRDFARQKLAGALPDIPKKYDVEGCDPDLDDIWKKLSGKGGPQRFTCLSWEENWIEYHTKHGRCLIYNIRAAREQVVKLLPKKVDRVRSPDEASSDKKGWAVRRARELMDVVYPNREWRTMGIRPVRKACEPIAKTRQVALPSADSFARAMGRRHK